METKSHPKSLKNLIEKSIKNRAQNDPTMEAKICENHASQNQRQHNEKRSPKPCKDCDQNLTKMPPRVLSAAFRKSLFYYNKTLLVEFLAAPRSPKNQT